MDSRWAADNLQVIRTLMERASTYRRALAPVMLTNGVLGTAAAVFTCFVPLQTPVHFSLFWAAVAALGLGISFLRIRRQALRQAEPFWTPPTRRVTQALLPGLFLGGLVLPVLWIRDQPGDLWLAAIAWTALYGVALHAAGFFMPRGVKLFGWAFLGGAASALFALLLQPQWQTPEAGHWILGLFFGPGHLAYGGYLRLTERTAPAS